MAKKIRAYVKLQIPAGKATPAPPIGPALGQHGVAIMNFCKEYNERTQSMAGQIIPVVITVYEDRSFTFVTKTPPGGGPAPEGRWCWQGRRQSAHDQGRQGFRPTRFARSPS